MIGGRTNKEAVLGLLMDGKPHYSAEFRDTLNLLEYRKRVSELRQDGHIIKSVRIGNRPGYQLMKETPTDLFHQHVG